MTGSQRDGEVRQVGLGPLVGVLSALIVLSTPQNLTAQAVTKSVAVEAVTLAPSQLVETVSAIGTLRSNEAVIVRSEIGGRIVRIGFDEGQPIAQGIPMFRLDDTIFRAELAESQARQDLSARNYERAKALENRGHGSVETLDRALAQMRVDQASVKLTQARLGKTTILAPFDGIVGLRQVSIGDYVEAGQDLVNLEDIDPIKIEFRLPERYLRVIRQDGPIRVAPDALPGESFEGRIYAIDPRIEPGGRSVAIRAQMPNEGRLLRPGMFVRVRLIVDRNANALVVPEEAIVRRGDRQVVYRVVDGKAVSTPVTLGLRETGRVEVVDGLKPGDTVVTAGHAKLREGTPVEVSPPTGAKG